MFVTGDAADRYPGLLDAAHGRRIRVSFVTDRAAARLSDTVTPPGIIAVCDLFDVPIEASQLYLFVFLGAVAAGTLGGGPVGDRLGFKTVIWVSKSVSPQVETV